jgi:DNA-binding transcriptional regulator YdaS (Cro superfamily)
MKKSDAIQIFGNASALARAVGLTRGRISQWPSKLTQKQADLVNGAALRLGMNCPPEAKAKVA